VLEVVQRDDDVPAVHLALVERLRAMVEAGRVAEADRVRRGEEAERRMRLDDAALSRFNVLPVLFGSATELTEIMRIHARRLSIDLDGDPTPVMDAYMQAVEAQTGFALPPEARAEVRDRVLALRQRAAALPATRSDVPGRRSRLSSRDQH